MQRSVLSALFVALGCASAAHAQDAGASDGGAQADAGTSADAGSQGDAGASADAGPGMDGGGATTPACSCETSLDSDGRIHLCTGSFETQACMELSCEDGTRRAQRCAPEGVGLCCEMPARGLYSHMYEDCTHPNCESGFRAQCEEFGGTISEGACGAPELPDDPDTDVGSEASCSLASVARPSWATTSLLVMALALLGRRRRRQPSRSR